jgi:glycosyltransferase involved in cell wall biosynthesis
MARVSKISRGHSNSCRRTCVVAIALVIFILALVFSSNSIDSRVTRRSDQHFPKAFRSNVIQRPNSVDVSVILLTYNKSDYIAAISSSLFRCNIDWSVELVVADNGCFDHTISVVNTIQSMYGAQRVRRIPICTNRRYADANNFAAVSVVTKWILFLNDDVIPDDSFLGNMKMFLDQMGAIGVSLAAVAPKLLFPSGRVIEAGSIVRADGTTDNFYRYVIPIRYRSVIDDARYFCRGGDGCNPQVQFSRPVHYSSAACLLVAADAFAAVGGFRNDLYEVRRVVDIAQMYGHNKLLRHTSFSQAYFEDTHLQMDFTHTLHLDVMYK